jgi:hypothetical protein
MTPRDIRKPAPGRIIVAPEYPGCIGTGDAPAIGQSAKHPDRYPRIVGGVRTSSGRLSYFWRLRRSRRTRRCNRCQRPIVSGDLYYINSGTGRASYHAECLLTSSRDTFSVVFTLSDSGQIP